MSQESVYLHSTLKFSDFMDKISEIPLNKEFLAEFTSKLIPKYQHILSKQEALKIYQETHIHSHSTITKKKWKKEEKMLLLFIVFHYMNKTNKELNKRDWRQIGSLLQKPWTVCCFKFHSMASSQSELFPWSPEDDILLSNLVHKIQKSSSQFSWIEVALEFFELSKSDSFRRPGHCRERWISHLDPTLQHKEWSSAEDDFILRNYLNDGSKWKSISEKLKGRSMYDVKNRFSKISKEIGINKNNKDNVKNVIYNYLNQNCFVNKKVHIECPQTFSNAVPQTNIQNIQQFYPNSNYIQNQNNYYIQNPCVNNYNSFYFQPMQVPIQYFVVNMESEASTKECSQETGSSQKSKNRPNFKEDNLYNNSNAFKKYKKDNDQNDISKYLNLTDL